MGKRRPLGFLAAALLAMSAFAGAAESQWSRLEKPFACEVPADWPSASKKDLRLAGPDSGSGYKPMLSAVFQKEGGEFASAEEYIRAASGGAPAPGVAALLGGKLPAGTAGPKVLSVQISGRNSFRFVTKDSFTREHPRQDKGGPSDKPGSWGPIPVRHLNVVVPAKKGFWVLRGSASEKDFEDLLPVFERFLASVRLK